MFGGFTPVEWDSAHHFKADVSLKSFLFTLKNPHNIPSQRFVLKAERKEQAIWCSSTRCPNFYDIYVADKSNTKTVSSTTDFGNFYTNNTGLDGTSFFTGSKGFQVKEIEVFEIAA
jgi:hypothetical protein